MISFISVYVKQMREILCENIDNFVRLIKAFFFYIVLV